MPKQYEKIRDSLIARGKSTKEAKRIAAATYNKHHKENPVGPNSDKRSESMKKRNRAVGIGRYLAKQM